MFAGISKSGLKAAAVIILLAVSNKGKNNAAWNYTIYIKT